jgi:Uma2 family endonuclease
MPAHSSELSTILVEKKIELPTSIEEPFYPESDGKPMAETDIHRDLMVDIILALRDFYRDAPDVYVSGNLLMYYTEGVPTDNVAPDVFVVKGVPKRRRRIYKIWEERKAPDVVIELTSKSTRRDDILWKKELYESLQVSEYFLFDPLGEYLQPALQGYRLIEGWYKPIISFGDRNPPYPPLGKGGYSLRSLVLNMELVHQEETLFLIDLQTGKRLLTPLEEAEAKRKAQAKWQEAEVARKQAEAVREQMIEKWQQEATARKALEAELARLKRKSS